MNTYEQIREALVAIDKNTDLLDIAEDVAPNLHPSHAFVAVQIRKIVHAALAVPRRNCDVGTVLEQTARFNEFCNVAFKKWLEHGNTKLDQCSFCELSGNRKCAFTWEQMPYKTDLIEKEG